MIPRAHIVGWRAHAPWPEDALVEQDLVLSRATVELFADPTISAKLALRGGTAFNKLFLARPARYSDDIDLVQTSPEPIGAVLDAIRARLDPWLDTTKYKARHKTGEGVTNLVYRFDSEIAPVKALRLKLEINTREHFTVFGHTKKRLEVESAWFKQASEVVTYSLDELLGTKLRALYQRKKGRDLYDLWLALAGGGVDPRRIVEAFSSYIAHEGTKITREDFEKNLRHKATDADFLNDIVPLLAPGANYDAKKAVPVVMDTLVALL